LATLSKTVEKILATLPRNVDGKCWETSENC
jgi:hypothetical protein